MKRLPRDRTRFPKRNLQGSSKQTIEKVGARQGFEPLEGLPRGEQGKLDWAT